MNAKIHTKALSILFLTLGSCTHAQQISGSQSGQNISNKGPVTAFDETSQPGVVMLAITDPKDYESASDESRRSAGGDAAAKTGTLFDVQVDIAEAVASTGSDLLMFINSPSVRDALYSQCVVHPKICDSLTGGHSRIVEIPFEGPWIRDYGPQFGFLDKNQIRVNDARYEDIRYSQSIEDKIDSIDQDRLRTINSREMALTISDLISRLGDDEDDEEAAARLIQMQKLDEVHQRRTAESLMLLQHKRDVLTALKQRQRVLDDKIAISRSRSRTSDARLRPSAPAYRSRWRQYHTHARRSMRDNGNPRRTQ